MKLKLFFFVLLAQIFSSGAFAYDAEIDGIYYTFSETAATVSSGDNKYTGDIVIPETVSYNGTTYSVTSIGDRAFEECSGLTSVTIPNSVTSIGDAAFYYCSGLTSITIPNSVTSIGDRAFNGCNGLTSVTDNRDAITSFIRQNKSIKEYIIGNSATSIGAQAFYGLEKLTSVKIGNSVTIIGQAAFRDCAGLTSIEIPNSVKTIEDLAFMGCSGLTSVTIPSSVTSIAPLRKWNIFTQCEALASIHVEEGNTVYDSRDNCNAIIETSTNTLMSGCQNTVIPNSVTSILDAFNGCSRLTSITIPNSVTTIGESAFNLCTSLTSVISEIEVPFAFVSGALIGAFNNISSSCVLYVPKGTRDAYIAAGWTEEVFKGGIVEMEGNDKPDNIVFADANVKAICVANWDTDGDGELSKTEAAAVTDIGQVFKGNQNITSFDELQYFTGITAIGEQAFFGCFGLTSVTIPNNVTSIGIYAFAYCRSLTSVTIPGSVTSIGMGAFSDCSSLISVTIPNSVTGIGENAFSKCSSLTSVTIPNSVTSIGIGAFSKCSSLTSVTIPNSVTSIGGYAFYECSSLTSVTIPNSVTSIGEYAFCNCSGLTSVVAEMTTPFAFGGGAFKNISSSCVLTVPKGTRDAYIAAGWTEEVFKGGIVEMEGDDKPDNIVFADANVKAICVANWDTDGDGELSYAEAAAVTDIGQVFKVNKSITSFDELQYFTGLTSICDRAFYAHPSLISVTIPNSVTSIGRWAFYYCSGLTSITIPNSVTSIDYQAFGGCSGLTSVTIPNSVTSISDAAFGSCTGLESLVVESGCTEYDSRGGCNAIIHTASNTLVAGCKNTTIPESVTSIGVRAFIHCSSLTTVTIPNSVTSIGYQAFSSCSGLTSVTIPNSVTSIGDYAFEGCSGLTSVTIPNSVTSIGEGAFYVCSGLTSVVSEMTTPFAFGSQTFYEISSSCVLYVPKGTRDAYIAAGWTEEVFKGGIVEMEGEDDPIEDKTHEFVMERKYLVHHAGRYNETKMVLHFDNNNYLTVGYFNTGFWNGAYCNDNPFAGVHIMSGEEGEGYNDDYDWNIAPIIVDEWVKEKLIVKSDGHVQYWMNDQYMGEKLFDNLDLQNATNVVVEFQPWGWNTGHYQYMDDFKFSTPTKSISDNFDDGVLDTDIWQSPVNPDGVREEDGIVKMEQLRTDKDFKLRSLPIPLKSSRDDDDLDVADAFIEAGESNIVEIGLTNGHTDLVAFQMDLTLPEGVSIDKTGCALSSRITDEEQTLTVGKLESGAYRITSTSFSLTPISGNDGTLFGLKLTAEDGCIGGQATISNIIFSTSESEKLIMSDKAFDISILYNLTYMVEGVEFSTTSVAYGTVLIPDAEPTAEGYTFGGWSELPETMPNHDVEVTGRFYLYGDVNTDEAVDVVDVVDIARFVVTTPSVNFREKLADLNSDNMVNIADAVTLVNHIAGDQNFVKAMTSSRPFNYDQCQLQLLSTKTNALSICLDGDADFTAFQFEVELPENRDVTAMRISGLRKDGHQLLFNKVADNRYRVAALSLDNSVFKGSEGELLSICIDGLPTEEISVHDILFVTKNGTGITFDSISLSDTVTGIANVHVSEDNGVIFDLQGRKLSKVQRGVNIINGKKIIVNK